MEMKELNTILFTIKKVCDEHNISYFELIGNDRRRNIVKARKKIANIFRKDGFSLTEIGVLLGRRDTSTIRNLLK